MTVPNRVAVILGLSLLTSLAARGQAVIPPGPTVTATVAAGTNPQAVAVNPVTNKIYVANGGNSVTVIDGATNATTTVTDPNASSPYAVAVNPVTNQIYVANNGSNNVTVIDGATNATTTVGAGTGCIAIAVNPITNKIYVANQGSNNVTVIDGATNTTNTVSVGTGPQGVAVNPSTNLIYVANGASKNVTVINGVTNATTTVTDPSAVSPFSVAVNSGTDMIYVGNYGSSNVTAINGGTNTTTTITVGTHPTAVAVNPITSQIYVTNSGSANVTVINGFTNGTTTVAAGTDPLGVAVNPLTNMVYVANGTSNNVTVIDGATNATVTLADPNATGPYAVGVNPVTDKTYVANLDSNNVTVIDGATNATTSVTDLNASGAYELDVNPVTNQIYVSNNLSNNVTDIDGSTNSTTTVAAGTGPSGVAVNPVTNMIYVANGTSNNVTVINGATNGTTTVADPNAVNPFGVAVNPVTNKIYVGNFLSNNVTVIDGATNATTTVAAGTSPYAVAVNPVTNKIYVANDGSANVTVIDGVTNATTTVAAGSGPHGVAVNPVTNKIYVANQSSGNVTVIDGATNATATVAAGTSPYAVAVNPLTNKIYVTNLGSSNVTVIDGATNATTTVPVATTPEGVAVNPTTNKIYVANHGSNSVTVIDGATNTTTTVALAAGSNPANVAVNPVTNQIYLTVIPDVTVITEQNVTTFPLSVGITALPGNTTTSATQLFDFTAFNDFSSFVDNLVFQADTWQGPWPVATSLGDFAYSGTVTNLLPGFHILYAYATDGQEATSINTGFQSSPLIGNITAYGFLATPPVAGLSTPSISFSSQIAGTASGSQTVTVANTGTASLILGTVAISGTNASDFTITADTCSSAVIGPTLTCSVSVTFIPSAPGPASASLNFPDNAPGSPQTVSLTGTGTSPFVPGLNISPPSLTFASQAVGTTSAPQTVMLTNTGTGTLVILRIAASGDFAQTNTCGSSLAVGANCTISVTFTPTASGARTGDLTINDNAGSGLQSVSLSGTGAGTSTSPGVVIAPPSLTFTAQTVGTTSPAQSITLTYTGSGSLTITSAALTGANASDFAKSADTCSGATVASGGMCSVSITFTPSIVGSETATLSITDNAAGSPQTVNLSGTGVSTAPGIGLFTSNLSFGSQVVGSTSAAQVVIVTDSGAASVSFSGFAVSGDFAIDPSTTSCSTSTPLEPDLSCTVGITFTPTATGSPTGTLTLSDNAGTGTQVVTLNGNGITSGVVLTPSSLTFGSQAIGATSAVQSVTLTNTSTSPLTFTTLSVSGDFALDPTSTCSTSSPLAPLATCTIALTFTPTTAAARTGTVTIADSVSGGTQLIALRGLGTGANPSGVTLALRPSSLMFGAQAVGTTSGAQSVTLTNTATTASNLTFTALSVSGDFVFDPTTTCSTSSPTAPGGNCTIVLAFTPKAAGTRTGTVIITDNAGSSPQIVSLTGQGTTGVVGLSASSLSFGSQPIGTSSAAQIVTLTNGNTSPLTIASIAANGDFAATNNCGSSLAANASCTISVVFTPSAAGARTGTLTVTDDYSTSPQTVALTGTGASPGASLSPTSLSFAHNINATCPPKSATLTNTGNTPLNIASIAASGDFAIDPTTTTCSTSSPLAPGASCAIGVDFQPTSIGPFTGALTVSDNAPASPQTVALSGAGLAPCSPLAASSQAVAVVRGADSAGFQISDPKPSCHTTAITLACKQNGPVSCTFNPAAMPPTGSSQLTVGNLTALQSDTLNFQVTGTSGSEGQDTTAVNLTVQLEDFSFGPPYPASNTVTAGQTASYALTLSPLNNLKGSIQLSCQGAPAGATCSVSPQAVTLDGVTPVQATLTVSTTARSLAPPRPGSRPTRGPETIWWISWLLLALLTVAALTVAAVGACPGRDRRPALLVRCYSRAFIFVGTLLLVIGWAACGGGSMNSSSSPAGTPVGNYDLTVTGTYSAPGSGQTSTFSHEAKVKLVVN